jgi:PAS domain-containing protein
MNETPVERKRSYKKTTKLEMRIQELAPELTKSHEALQVEVSNINLAAIVETSNDAIHGKTLEGIVVNWNKSAERIFGYSAQEIVGRSVSILIPSDRADELQQILERIKCGESVDQYERCAREKMAPELTYPRRFHPSGMLPAKSWGRRRYRAISPRKKAASIAHLQELSLLQADKMISLGVLVSGMAHEINNPNNYILLNSRIVSRVWNDVKPILEQYYEKAGDFPLAGMPYSQAYEKIGQLANKQKDG